MNTNPWRTILMLIPVKDICGKSGVISGKDAKKNHRYLFEYSTDC